MKYYIVIDCGTTNTRISLINLAREVLYTYKANVGVKNTAIDGNNSKIKDAVKKGIEEIIKNTDIDKKEIKKILASGMITSDVGLYELPHITAPAGKEDFKILSKEVLIEDVCDIPITFIPGVKNNVSDIKNQFEAMDIMRGEEVETIAVLETLEKNKEYLIVLPGSHTKFIHIDNKGKITGCLTTLTGELIETITKNTIIADSVGRDFVNEYDKESTIKGAKVTEKTGFGRAAFSVRIYNRFVENDKNLVANYLLGVCLKNDVIAVKNSSTLNVNKDINVVVAGKEPLKTAIIDVFKEDGYFKNVFGFNHDKEKYISALGAISIFESR